MKIKLIFLIVVVAAVSIVLTSPTSASDDTTKIAGADDATTINRAERPCAASIQNDYPKSSGPYFMKIAKLVLPFMNELKPEWAKSLSETKFWFGGGIKITGTYLHKGKMPLEDCAQTVKIRAVNEEEKATTAENLVGGIVGEATKEGVSTLDLIGSLVYAVWERGGVSLVFTAEGYRRVTTLSVSDFAFGYTNSFSLAQIRWGNLHNIDPAVA